MNQNKKEILGLAARYESTQRLLEAARRAKDKGYRLIEAYSPHPVEGISEILGQKELRIPWIVFIGGICGGLTGFMMQYIANVWDLPLDIGGKPYNSWPAFIPITFELTILFAAISGFLGFIIRCKLPKVYHPTFSITGFEKATLDKFFLCIFSEDKHFDLKITRDFLNSTNPEDVNVIET